MIDMLLSPLLLTYYVVAAFATVIDGTDTLLLTQSHSLFQSFFVFPSMFLLRGSPARILHHVIVHLTFSL